jgi:O-antigen ligase
MAVCTLATLLAGILVTLVAVYSEPVFTMLGRDPTLTGRTDIWSAVLHSGSERPWLGYGYNAFWQEWNGPSAAVLTEIGWEAPNSHNGLLDLWLELGFAGVGALLIGLISAARAGLLSARRAPTIAGLWPLVFLSYLVLINVSMSVLLRPHSLSWILYVALLGSDLLAGVDDTQSGSVRGKVGPYSKGNRNIPQSSVGPVRKGHVSPGVSRIYRR